MVERLKKAKQEQDEQLRAAGFDPDKKIQLKTETYDIVVVEADDIEAQRRRYTEDSLEIIQQQKRVRWHFDNETKFYKNMGDYAYMLPLDWILDVGCVPCESLK